MISSLHQVNKLQQYLTQKINDTENMLNNLEAAYKKAYPEDQYGLKWMEKSQKKRDEYLEDLQLYKAYSRAVHDMIHTVEVIILKIQEDDYEE